MTAARIALVLVLTLVAPALAQTPEPGCSSDLTRLEALFLGVSELTVALTCPQQQGAPATSTAHVIRVNLGAPGLRFETSGAAGSGAFPVGPSAIFDQELPTAFLKRTNSQVAFNANLFTNCCCDDVPGPGHVQTRLIGLEVSGGKVLSGIRARPAPLGDSCGASPAPQYPFDHSLLVSKNSLRIERFVVADAAAPVEAAVTGSHVLVSGGSNVAPSENSGEFFGTNARTLVGLSGDDRILWIAAVDRSSSDGVTLAQAAQLMIQLGATTAINLDGGGSTSLVVEDPSGAPRLLNLPNDTPVKDNPYKAYCVVAVKGHCERFVGASFGIHALPLPPPPPR
jgi:hypothetical protein